MSRIKGLLHDTRSMYGNQISDVSEQWNGSDCRFRLKIWMFPLSGTISVGPAQAEVRGRLPLGTGRYEARARSLIEQRVRELLSAVPERD